ncbi:NAD(P)-binding protein [Auriculariales sp. MPI-PUGE-AT-0066]|nr:NAD(P)-binding protein [Auriculariales sp. MPI-PUGE-AT-0066]
MSFISELFPPTKSPWTGDNMPDQSGKVFIVTGGNSGIGKETCRHLLLKGGKVYMGARSRERAEVAIAELATETGGRKAIFLPLDLADLASVKTAAVQFLQSESQLHVLFNSGGVMATPIDQLTKDGYDLQFGTNVIGHYYLTTLLLPTLVATSRATGARSRIITTAAALYRMHPRVNYATLRDGPARRKLDPQVLYAQSKFANIVLSNEYARRYGQDIVAVSLHPGVFHSELQKHIEPSLMSWLTGLMTVPLWMGALNQMYAGTMPEAEKYHGKYMIPWVREGCGTKEIRDIKTAQALWDWLEQECTDSLCLVL